MTHSEYDPMLENSKETVFLSTVCNMFHNCSDRTDEGVEGHFCTSKSLVDMVINTAMLVRSLQGIIESVY